MDNSAAPLSISGQRVFGYCLEHRPEGWHMRQLAMPASEWGEVVKWVLANGFWDHIVHEDDYGYGDPTMMMWTKAQYEYALKSLDEGLGRGSYDSFLKIRLYLSDDAEMHYKLKFD